MFEAITIPNEEGVFSLPDGIKLADRGYLKLPNGKFFHYRISAEKPVFIFTEVRENEIFIDEEILPMFAVSFIEFEGKRYIRADRKNFIKGEYYRFPDENRLYFCIAVSPLVRVLPTYRVDAPPRVLGNGLIEVYDLAEVVE